MKTILKVFILALLILISRPISSTIKNINKRLFTAIQKNNPKEVERIIKWNKSVINTMDELGRTPLMLVSYNNIPKTGQAKIVSVTTAPPIM